MEIKLTNYQCGTLIPIEPHTLQEGIPHTCIVSTANGIFIRTFHDFVL